MIVIIARSVVLWIALWLSIPLLFQCWAIAAGTSDGEIGWPRLSGISFLWALFFMLGAL